MESYEKFINDEIEDIWDRIAESTAMPEESNEDDDENGAA